MGFSEKLLVVLYAAIALFVIMEFFDLWNLAVVFLGILVISIVQKISIERKVESIKVDKTRIVDVISSRIESFSGSVESIRKDFSRSIEFLDNKINVVNNIYEGEMKKGHAEISDRISSFEEKLDNIRQSLDAIYKEDPKNTEDVSRDSYSEANE